MKVGKLMNNTNVTAGRVNYKQAAVTFLLAYLSITILATAFSFALAAAKHVPPGTAPLDNPAYLLAERFLPVINLLVWMAFAKVYFKKQRDHLVPSVIRTEAFLLGAFWLAIAVPVDFVGFVLIKNPISLSPHDFYIRQFPWIYLIYLSVFLGPRCYIALAQAQLKEVPD
jgi:hypothetical protein